MDPARLTAKALLEAGKTVEAAQALAQAGDVDAAAKLLFRERHYLDAARLLLTDLRVATVEITSLPPNKRKQAERAALYFEQGGDDQSAGEIFEALGDRSRSALCFERVRLGQPTPPPPNALPSPAARTSSSSSSGPAAHATKPAHASDTAGMRTHAQDLHRRGELEAAAQLYARLGDRDSVESLAPSLDPRTAATALCAVGSFFRAAQSCLQVDDKRTAYECLVRVPEGDAAYTDACKIVVELVWPMRFVDARLLLFLASWSDNPWPPPEDLEALCHVAELTAKVGRMDEARALYRHVLAVSPTYKVATDGMAALAGQPVITGAVVAHVHEETVDRVLSDAGSIDEVAATRKLAKRVADLKSETLVGGRYRLGKKLGRGGMGIVFEAFDQELDEPVAIKFLLPLHDKAAVTRFKREITMSRKLVHPNIVRVFDLGMENDLRYVTMELLTGEDLGSRKKRPMDMQVLVDILVQACRGLHAAHEQGIVHRDVKPPNIFIINGGIVKMMDFGIAREAGVGQGLTKVGGFVGTPRYMAPEAFLGEAGPAADLYSLGVTAYEVLCGKPPFEEKDPLPLMWKHVGEKPVPPSQRNRSVPEALNELVMHLLEKKPGDRPESAAFVGDTFEKIGSWLVLNAPTLQDDDD